MANLHRDSHETLRKLGTRIRHGLLAQALGEMTALYTEKELESMEKDVLPALRQAGLKARLIQPRQIEEQVMGFNARGAVAGFVTGETFVVHHDAVLYGLLRTLQERGVQILCQAHVSDFVTNGFNVTGVIAGGRIYTGGKVILCTGAATLSLLEKTGWRVPLTVVRQQTIVTETVRSMNWPVIRWTGPVSSGSCHRSPRGEILAACQNPQGTFKDNNGTSSVFLTRTLRQLYDHIPVLRDVAVIRQWGGVTTKTDDHLPYAGPVPERNGLWALFGMNAFTMFPWFAQTLADVLLGGKEHSVLSQTALSLNRGLEPCTK
jgi:sarcosine oxidase subunit beta